MATMWCSAARGRVGTHQHRVRHRADFQLAELSDAPLFTTRVLDGGAQLAFSGVGIRSLGVAGAPAARQALFANGDSVGGTILFSNSSGIKFGRDQFARPVNVTVQERRRGRSYRDVPVCRALQPMTFCRPRYCGSIGMAAVL